MSNERDAKPEEKDDNKEVADDAKKPALKGKRLRTGTKGGLLGSSSDGGSDPGYSTWPSIPPK